ncbi:MAG TPA: hypothetical protein VF449_06600 [Parvibaculum sp.]
MSFSGKMEAPALTSVGMFRRRGLARLAAAGLALGFVLFLGAGVARADGVDLGCDPDSCGPVQVPPCDTCGDHSIGADGGAGAPGQPIDSGDDQ